MAEVSSQFTNDNKWKMGDGGRDGLSLVQPLDKIKYLIQAFY